MDYDSEVASTVDEEAILWQIVAPIWFEAPIN